MENKRILRLVSMLLDHFIMTIIIVPLGIMFFVFGINGDTRQYEWVGFILVYLPFFVYFNKDFFRGRSLAKRFLGYQVVDKKTNKPASELQCFTRNLTIPAWPIEVIIGFIFPERRIGDLLANTKVIKSEKENIKSIWNDLKNYKLKLNNIVILIISILYFYGVHQLMYPNMN